MVDDMDNRNRDSADNSPTQQFWPAPGPGGSGGRTGGGRDPRRTRHVARWAAGLAATAVLVGGGTVALAAAGHATAPSEQAAPTGQAATLNTVLSSADSPSLADQAATAPTTSPPAGPAAVGARAAARCARVTQRLRGTRHSRAAHRVGAVCRHRLARVRLLVRGIHGQFTFQTKKGAKTLAFERGTVQAMTATTVTVRASDATTWTWHLVSNTVVRQIGSQQVGGGRSSKKVGASGLADGQRVFVGGPVVGGADNARLIVIRPATSATTPTT
jgi:hypothetical protein